MVKYRIKFTKQATKDKKLLKSAKLEKKAQKLINILEENPFQNPPPYEKLVGHFTGLFSRRINFQHRLVYEVDQVNKIVYIYRMWSHYDKVIYTLG